MTLGCVFSYRLVGLAVPRQPRDRNSICAGSTLGGLAVFSGNRVGGGVLSGWAEHVTVFDRHFAFRFAVACGFGTLAWGV